MLELNVSSSATKWRLNHFAAFHGTDPSLYLNVGDVIKLYHRELEGFLAVASDDMEEGK